MDAFFKSPIILLWRSIHGQPHVENFENPQGGGDILPEAGDDHSPTLNSFFRPTRILSSLSLDVHRHQTRTAVTSAPFHSDNDVRTIRNYTQSQPLFYQYRRIVPICDGSSTS
jgi:hypothetical protein